MSQVHEAVLDLSVAEASLLADVLGVAPPPGLVDPDDDDDVAAPARVAVAPGLVERRILDNEGTVAAPVADLLTAVGCPHLVARAVHEVDGVAETRSFAVRPEMAVEQRGLTGDVVRFTPFHPAELVERIMAFVSDAGGDEVSAGSAMVSFECPVAVIEQLFQAAGDPEADRVNLLEAAGVDSGAAEAFAAAVVQKQATNSVTILHRPADHEVIGVDLTWMDSGAAGLWLTEPVDATADRRSIEQISPDQLASKLAEFLPFG